MTGVVPHPIIVPTEDAVATTVAGYRTIIVKMAGFAKSEVP